MNDPEPEPHPDPEAGGSLTAGATPDPIPTPTANPTPDPTPDQTPDPVAPPISTSTADPTGDPAADPAADRPRVRPRDIWSMALRTARAEPGRVFIPALFIFGLDAANSTLFTEFSVDHLGTESLGAALVLLVSTLGLTFYSGLLERLVGAVERGHEAPAVGQVLRTLPYVRLLVADGILWALGGLASLAFVIPGLIITTLFALIGPLINMEDLSVRAAFRRSASLVAPRFLLVLFMITLPLGIEHELVDAIAYLVPHEHIWLVFLTYLAGGLSFGVLLGLVEVSLAERLVNNAAGPRIRGEAPLPSDQPGPPGQQGGRHGRDDSRNGHAGAGALPPTR
jgi:hypothetical protein